MGMLYVCMGRKIGRKYPISKCLLWKDGAGKVYLKKLNSRILNFQHSNSIQEFNGEMSVALILCISRVECLLCLRGSSDKIRLCLFK